MVWFFGVILLVVGGILYVLVCWSCKCVIVKMIEIYIDIDIEENYEYV